MRRILYTTLAKVTKGIQAVFSVLVPLIRTILGLLGRLIHAFVRKLVFIALKFGRFLRRYWQGYSAPFKDKVWFIVTSPWTLRTVVLGGILAVLLPQTSLFAYETRALPQESLLYQLVGPGEEYFVEEGIDSDASGPIADETWHPGAVRQEVIEPGTLGEEAEEPDFTSLALGGTALQKPTIIPGAEVGGQRKEVVNYVVQTGDTIGGVAQAFGISLNTVLWENGLTFRSYIRPGDTLRILPVDGIRHEVKRGDTLAKIAKLYGADVQRIIEFNKLSDASDISIGQKLILPGGTKPAPVYRAPSVDTRFGRVVAPLPSIFIPAGQLYIWPTTVKHITQYFGWRHTGVDIGGPVGTPLLAARAGRVVKAQCGWNGGYGCYIIIDHGDGVRTLYGHSSRIFVDVGENVEQGQTIAAMGSTGRSTGSHLHFEVRVNGVRTNPLKFVR